MPQLFDRSFNYLSRISIIAIGVLVAAGVTAAAFIYRSPVIRGQQMVVEQPVPFSHEHHVAGLGIDCRFCHWSVEKSSFAGIPPTKVCMTCHSQVFTDAPMLEPVRESFRSDQPIQWVKVHDLAKFVYFNHSIHIAKGIGCNECHGRIDKMSLTFQESTLYMQWCLQCHREPERFVRPKDQVFNMAYQQPANQAELGKQLVQEYQIENKVNCSTCHH
ncbi:MAG: cytochrome c family protein [Candidatus Sumerlaeaceae bacterium]|nr:cytochrome c family protein [Candidatus Sumerlaeaceae bacterium]